MARTVIISVISDLVTDQRVKRTAMTLHRQGYIVCLAGRRLRNSQNLNGLPYQTRRFSLPFEKGPLFYLVFQFRLFFFLLFRKADLLVANDLDTLLPNYFISRLKGSKLLYDSHEYFTGVPELERRPVVQRIWKMVERFVFPKLSYIITVNESIATLYEQEYHKKIGVVRNIPDWQGFSDSFDAMVFRKEHGLPAERKIIILQGSGINIHRGAEEALTAMEFVNDAVLLIVGSGDVIQSLHEMSRRKALAGKVIFRDKMSFEEMMQYTRSADLGLTLDKDTNINYRYSLPNKLFDYIHAGIAVLATDLVEVKRIVTGYGVGEIAESLDPVLLAARINGILADSLKLENYKMNAKKAAGLLTWQHEQKQLLSVVDELFR